MSTTLTLSEHVGKAAACQALGVARACLGQVAGKWIIFFQGKW